MTKRISHFQCNELTKSLILTGLAGWLGCTAAVAQDADPTPANSETSAAETPAAAETTTAQTAAPAKADDAERVTVVGSFRQGLSVALDKKRDSNGAIDAVVAEDIADFPDLNLAESLQRIPGVAISRAAGEGRQISVRGLGPDFTRVRINGMEAIATSGGTDAIGGANRGRGFDFNTFSSDLFSSLTVRKTAAADVEEGSLGATVDLRAVQPFDYDGFTLVTSAQAGYNDLSEETDPKASFLISNTFDNRRFGVLFSAAYSERNLKDEGASTVRWDNVNDFGQYQGSTTAPQLAEINAAFRPRLPRYDSYTHEMERTGASASIQFKPTDASRLDFDVLYSKNESTRNEIFLQGILNANGQTTPMNVLDYEIDNTNTMTYGSFANATVRAENRYDELSTEFTQYTLNYSQYIGDDIKINALAGRAESKFDNPVQTTLVTQKSGVGFSYDYRGSRREDPILTFSDAVFDPNGWLSNSVRLRPLGADNTFDTLQFDIEYVLNDTFTLKGGVMQKEFDFETFEARRQAENAGGIVYTPELLSNYNSGLGPHPVWVIPNIDAVNAAYSIYSNTGQFVVSEQFRLPDNYSANEKTLGYYAQLLFNTDIGALPFRGDVGFRQVETDQSSTAWATVATTATQITAKHDYRELLPSMNLVLEPYEDVLLRFSYAEVLARAGLGAIRPDVSVSVSGGSRSVTGGNPQLEPTTAKNYDLGLEFYFDNDAFLGLALFKKEIDSYVQTLRETKPFTETGLPVQIAIDACNAGPGYGESTGCTENADWQVTTPLNGPGGDIDGYEISFQVPFTFLPGFLQNFGFIGNYTNVDAELDYVNTAGVVVATRPLEGLSEDTSNATLYYETEDFSARVSVAKRSRYLTTAIGRNNNDMEGTNETRNVDASMSYQFNDHFKMTVEALNLTDEVDDQWVDDAGNRLSYYHSTGRQYYVGVYYTY